MDERDKDSLWYQTSLDVYLNRWYSDYAQAVSARERHGGFLLPFKNHFFVCEAEVISALGLDPKDPDWEKIGWNTARKNELTLFPRPAHQIFSAPKVLARLPPMNRDSVRNAGLERCVGRGASIFESGKC